MNRRSMISAVIGACAAMLFPWRKAKAKQSWAYLVDFAPSQHKYPGCGDQTKRIEQLLESRFDDGSSRRFSKRLAATARHQADQIGADFDVRMYEVYTCRHETRPETHLFLWNTDDEFVGLVCVTDSVALSMDDNQLYEQISQARLWAIYKDTTVWIHGYDKLRDYNGNRLIWIAGDLDKLGGFSKT